MPKRRILIILGHPDLESLNAATANTYEDAAEQAGHEVKRINLAELHFDPVLHKGYKVIQKLEPDLKEAQKLILWAEHLVFVYPMWWGSMPALMKGFIDRTFHPRFAFKFNSPESYLWDKLLKGRSARLIITTDGPPAAIKLLFSNPAVRAMKEMTLEFCGIQPVGVTMLGPVKRATKARQILWKIEVEELARRGL